MSDIRPTRHERPAIHSNDPMRHLMLSQLAGNDDLARLILAYFTVLAANDD